MRGSRSRRSTKTLCKHRYPIGYRIQVTWNNLRSLFGLSTAGIAFDPHNLSAAHTQVASRDPLGKQQCLKRCNGPLICSSRLCQPSSALPQCAHSFPFLAVSAQANLSCRRLPKLSIASLVTFEMRERTFLGSIRNFLGFLES